MITSSQRYFSDKTLHGLFEEQAEQTPDRVALIGDSRRGTGISITYSELNRKSNRLASLLRQKKVSPGTIIAIMVERSIEMVIGVLGILKAGGAYLPIDPHSPAERCRYTLIDANVKILVKTSNIISYIGAINVEIDVVFIEEVIDDHSLDAVDFHPSRSSAPAVCLAYILYTSGSTGVPKGVAVDHHAVVNLLFALSAAYPVLPVDAYLLKTSFYFDVSVVELFGWFLGGGRLVVLEKGGEKDPQRIIDTIKKHYVTHVNFTPAMFNMFVHHLDTQNFKKISGVRFIFVAGEALPPELAKRFSRLHPLIRLENLYGPTEGTVYASWYSLSGWNGVGSVPIGKPLPNVVLSIVDKHGQPVPVGETGELCIAGTGLAQGYLNNPGLTFERFLNYKLQNTKYKSQITNKGASQTVPSEITNKKFLRGVQGGSFFKKSPPGRRRQMRYRTGDLARWLPDGNIEFLGRMDFQVKIRGIRIELGEIESRLLMHKGVKEAVVTVREIRQGDKFLCAYIVREVRAEELRVPDISEAELRKYLASVLPDYMVPSFFIFLERLPLTGSGKVDRKVLPGPDIKRGAGYVAPRYRLEEKLVEIWADVLGIKKEIIGIDDDFLKLGGHSLKGAAVIYDIYRIFNVRVALRDLLEMAVIRKLSAYVKAAVQDRWLPLKQAEKREYYCLSPAQARMYILYRVNPVSTVYNLTTRFELEGVLDRQRLEKVLDQLIWRHESLRTGFMLVNGEPVQKIQGENCHISIAEIDKNEIAVFVQPFDLSGAPLVRVGLIRGEAETQRHILLVDMHHIITDGFSLELFANEFFWLYHAEVLAPLGFQYRDYSWWHGERKKGGELESQRQYWLSEFSGEIPLISLPLDYTRPAVQDFEGNVLYTELEKQERIELKAVAQAGGVTLYMLFLGAFTVLLTKISGQEDIIVGTPMEGRKHPELQQMMGMFVNTVAVRSFPVGGRRFDEFLREIKEKVLFAYENQEFPFEELVEEVVPERDISRNPLFDCVFALDEFESESKRGFDLGMSYSWHMDNTAKFDLTYTVEDHGDSMILRVEYRTGLFKVETVQRFIGYFKRILNVIQESPTQTISDIEIITPEEKKIITDEFNRTAIDYPREKVIHGLFAEQVERTPDHVALIGPKLQNTKYKLQTKYKSQITNNKQRGALRADFDAFDENISITYRELHEKSDQLAILLQGRGVQTEVIAGILMERSVDLVIAILAILKAGGAYLPLDTEYPDKRLIYMLADSNVRVLITVEDLIEGGKRLGRWEGEVVFFNSIYTKRISSSFLKKGEGSYKYLARPYNVTSGQMAYVMYTSGSTGYPKGVMVMHHNVVRLVKNTNFISLSRDTWILQTGSPVFDATTFEIWGSLLNGGRLVIVHKAIILNARQLGKALLKNKINTLWLSSPLYNQLVQGGVVLFSSLHYLLVGGDVLSPMLINKVRKRFPGLTIINGYGPTENTTFSTTYKINKEYRHSIPIGNPIANSTTFILDKTYKLQPVGIAGELFVGGEGISRGYLNKPELTFERFINYKIQNTNNVFSKTMPGRIGNQKLLQGVQGGGFLEKNPPGRRRQKNLLYRTGDLACWQADGTILFLGRIDHQVKVRGFRIELEEIENQLLNHSKIKEAVVTVSKISGEEEKELRAYIVSEEEISIREVRERLAKKLPEYMIPSVIMRIKRIPLNANGKIDWMMLPEPAASRQRWEIDYAAASSQLEQLVSRAWREVLKLDRVGIDEKFFELGGNSMKFIQVNDKLYQYLGRDLPVVSLYQYPTIRSLARYLSGAVSIEGNTSVNRLQKPFLLTQEGNRNEEIVVIGMAGRFPGAKNLNEFWQNLKNGVEAISFFSGDEMSESGLGGELLQDPHYVGAWGFLEDSQYFDTFFFNYTPKEAELMDPQLRLYHEYSWAALEDAGYNPGDYPGRIGVYSGAAPNVNWISATLSGVRATSEMYEAEILNMNSSFGTRISYNLSLRGPSFSVQTACSTSLVAVHLACGGLIAGECDMALAGGVSINSQEKSGYFFQEGMILSPDGHNRTFAGLAKGTVPGDGIGIVVLKRLEDAIRDGDHIYAMVKGSAINNDGARKAGYTAPSVEGQAEVIREALSKARVEADSITYVEAHGTATSMGDPIEISGLTLAYSASTSKKQYCRIGSVKTNIGHLDMAAGIAGFIKTVLSLYNRKIPPSLHFDSPNPGIDFENSPFVVNRSLFGWEAKGNPLRAGVSSFGIGGTNAHVILEEAPAADRLSWSLISDENKKTGEYRLLVLSAKTASALDRMSRNLVKHLKENPGIDLGAVAYTLQVGRKAFKHRRMLVCQQAEEIIDLLETAKDSAAVVDEHDWPVVFMFPGQGSQYVNMGLGLYLGETGFREEMNRCFEVLNPIMGDLKKILYPDPSDGTLPDPAVINRTEMAQPLIFVFEYALAKLLMRWGIKPDAMIGHSIGEYTAACLAGVLSLEDALAVVAARGQLMQQMPAGAMLSVSLPEAQVFQMLKPGLSLAAVNTSSNCVVSGPEDMVASLVRQLNEQGVASRLLHTSHAFHSAMMDPIMGAFENKLGQVTINNPVIPYQSNVTGQWIKPGEVINPGYWSTHLRQPVRFFEGMTALFKKDKKAILLEVGPGRALSTFTRQHPEKTQQHVAFNLVRHPREDIPDEAFLLGKIGNLWLQGKTIDWHAFHPRDRHDRHDSHDSHESRQRVALPTYPFEGLLYPVIREPRLHGSGGNDPHDTQLHKKADIADWFYMQSWKRVQKPVYKKDKKSSQWFASRWLVFIGDDEHKPVWSKLAKGLEVEEHKVILVKPGETFVKGNRTVIINPGNPADYERLFEELASEQHLPDRILHLWGFPGFSLPVRASSGLMDNVLDSKEVEWILDMGFYSLLNIARALGLLNVKDRLQIDVITNGLYEVTGDEQLSPAKATVLGAVKAIPLEYPNICCRSIDIAGDETCVMPQLEAELSGEAAAPAEMVALRGRHRWAQHVEPVHLEETLPRLSSRLKEKGVYLITGGLGGMGLTIAQYLAKSVKARLGIVDFVDWPRSEEQQQWLDTHLESDRISKKIRKIREIEQVGAAVFVVKADIADMDQMRQALNEIEKRFGTIDGVIQTAGVPDGRLIHLRNQEYTEGILAPKVKGTLVLDTLLHSRNLDFVVLCSSLTSILGEIGQAGYIAANSFLDAYAGYKTLNGEPGRFTVSINWDGWQEVGMAVKESGHEIVISRLNPETHWELGEHRVNGSPTLVRTAYLELIYTALAPSVRGTEIEIQNLYLVSPLTAAGEVDKDIEVRILLETAETGTEFSICTALPPDEQNWQVHARGKAAAVKVEALLRHNLAAIRQECPTHLPNDHISSEAENIQSQLAAVGARWDNIKELWLGNNQGLALLELPGQFADDTRCHLLHPALLDTATAFLVPYLRPGKAYLPFSCRRVRIKHPLPAKLFSYARLAEDLEAQELQLNITIMDETGKVLMDIEGFTLMEVSTDEGKIQSQTRSIIANPLHTGKSNLLKDGILPAEGVEVFNRVLSHYFSRLLISTVDLPLRIEREKHRRLHELTGPMQDDQGVRPAHPRPVISTEYLPPENEIQQALSRICQEVLGIGQIGINDDLFELGTDSLKALTVIARIHQKLNIEVSITDMFTYPSIARLAKYVESVKKSTYFSIAPVEKREYYPLSSVQQRLYYLQQMHRECVFYNMPCILIMEGKLEKERLKREFQVLIQRHESLRTSYQQIGEEPVQRIHDEVKFDIKYTDTIPEFKNAEAIQPSVENWKNHIVEIITGFIRPFDLSCAPLLRMEILQIENNTFLWMFDIHHISTDATGFAVFYKELEALYNHEELPAVKVQYNDFSQWQNQVFSKDEKKAGREMQARKEYWRQVFADGVPRLNLPTDFPRPEVLKFEGDRHYFTLSRAETTLFLELGASVGTTLFINVLAVLNVLLFKYSGQEDIVIGGSISGRPHADLLEVVGMFVNMLALRNFPVKDMTYFELLQNVKLNSLKAIENQDLPFEMLVELLNIETTASGNPILSVCLNVENYEHPAYNFTGLKCTPFFYEPETSKFDMLLWAHLVEGEIRFMLEYATELFKPDTAKAFSDHLLEIIGQVIENKEIRLQEVNISHDILMPEAEVPEIEFGF